jgi:hypothetical protein
MARGTWITDVFDEAQGLDEMVAVMGGDAPNREAGARTEHVRPEALPTLEGSRSETGMVIGVHWLLGFLKRLEKRVAALEAELASPHRTRRCPRCQDPTLEVIATGPHPEFGFAGIEQHEVHCSSARCGYRGSRLYDPNNYIC